jgi:hypothetical protein
MWLVHSDWISDIPTVKLKGEETAKLVQANAMQIAIIFVGMRIERQNVPLSCFVPDDPKLENTRKTP